MNYLPIVSSWQTARQVFPKGSCHWYSPPTIRAFTVRSVRGTCQLNQPTAPDSSTSAHSSKASLCSSDLTIMVTSRVTIGFDQRARCFASPPRSEEHTSELQSRGHLVCRPLL